MHEYRNKAVESSITLSKNVYYASNIDNCRCDSNVNDTSALKTGDNDPPEYVNSCFYPGRTREQ